MQSALLEAVQGWRGGAPLNPAAWLYRVACNRVLDQLRHDTTSDRILQTQFAKSASAGTSCEPIATVESSIDAQGLDDDILRLCFVVCHPGIALQARVMMALKHLCGFGVNEIARGLLMKPEAVKKQLQRSARQLASLQETLDLPSKDDIVDRLDSVHQVLYMMFNEGYSCARGEQVIREDVCAEAAQLCHSLCEHPVGNRETQALLALMMLQAARLPTRIDNDGNTLLLEHQDRSLWDQEIICEASRWLKASRQSQPGRYYLEASIAWLHSTAESLEHTPWQQIIACYDLLILKFDSPVHRLNRAIAVAHLGGIEDVRRELHTLEHLNAPTSRIGLLCTKAWLEARQGNHKNALELYDQVLTEDIAPHEWRLISTCRQRVLDNLA